MTSIVPLRVRTITEFHRITKLSGPLHPLISLIDISEILMQEQPNGVSAVFDFYSISVKRGLNYKMIYGQQLYDFDEGIMYFLAPGQVLRIEAENNSVSQPSGWLLLIHPDFLRHTTLSKHIRQYEYFGYSANEALFLSDREEKRVNDIIDHIRQECLAFTDQFSQPIIIAHLEALLGNADRFYHRQFITRNVSSHRIINKLENLLEDYFFSEKHLKLGIPSVIYVAEKLNVSPNYLSGLLKTLTGLNTQQHIHEKLVEAAKQKLSTTDLTVSEIAFSLGFEHLPSFSKMFKQKTGQSPVAFRQSFHN
ncbi:AraC-like DNA-binding protein [Mucilaginibacter sp. UYP25]|uniref:helix-turn-helix domain-containing protein n=1 Tax=unclassified Mucilaginibacter TaxID=2617802 RepID=UPI003392F581